MIFVFAGQAIPAGLHVRMNLETGLKEAKLMDGDDGSRYEQVDRSNTINSHDNYRVTKWLCAYIACTHESRYMTI